MSFSIDAEIGIVRLEFVGPFRFEEWRSAIEGVLADERYDPGFGFLLDRRRGLPPESSDIGSMIAFVRANQERFEGSHWAFLTSGLADYGMVRMTQGMTEDQPTEIGTFDSEAEAMAWLLRGGRRGDDRAP